MRDEPSESARAGLSREPGVLQQPLLLARHVRHADGALMRNLHGQEKLAREIQQDMDRAQALHEMNRRIVRWTFLREE
jgi:hypothetical protein